MVNKCYISITRQATDKVTLSFTNNYDESCEYNSAHAFCLTVMGADGNLNCVSLSYDDLAAISDIMRNLQDISNTIPSKDSGDFTLR